jgi:hypothetical protein
MAAEPQTLLDRLTAHVPAELRERNQWVVWRLEQRKDKPTKVPYSPISERRAKSTDPQTWSAFAQACEAYEQGRYAGLGFVFSAADPYVGIDFDGCVDAGVIDPAVLDLVRRLDSYSEFSQSGCGVHVIVRGSLPAAGRKHTAQRIEMYASGRFFVMTGDRVPDSPSVIQDRQAVCSQIHHEIFGRHSQDRATTPAPSSGPADDEVLARMFASAHGVEIEALWRGDTSAYHQDHSAADLALCNHLAFWCGGDSTQMDRLFRRSGLMREKWDRKARAGETYGQGTVARALAALRQIPAPSLHAINGSHGSASESAEDAPSVPGMRLPQIVTNDRQLPAITAEALAALVAANAREATQPVAYVRAGLLTRVVRDEQGEVVSQPLSEPAAKGLLARCATWVRLRVDKEGFPVTTATFPPTTVVRDLLALGHWPELPSLAGVVHCPTFGPSGKLHAHPGYNPETRLYHAGSLRLGETQPTGDAVRKAKELLLGELLVDFPFDGAASRAHALALLLLPFVRPLIDGPTPVHAIDAPTPGTGKGLLANACAYPARGRDLAAMPAAQDDGEWRKRLTALLLRSDSHILIDNITHPLDSASLAAALTQPVWADRLLGQTLSLHLPIQQVWIATGNNLVVSDEIARRCVRIRLDANLERPDQRSGFRHAHLMQWVRRRRPALVTAAVTLVQAWVEAGMPRFTAQHKGSYEVWAEVMGGILQVADVEGFLANDHELYEAAMTETARLAEFVEAWHQHYGEQEVQLKELFKLASRPDGVLPPADQGQWLGLLEEELGAGNELSRRTKLGRLLDRNQDRVVAGYKLGKNSRDRKRPRFHLQRLSGSQPAAWGAAPVQTGQPSAQPAFTGAISVNGQNG